MDDELEINIAIPSSAPRKPSGGAKRNDASGSTGSRKGKGSDASQSAQTVVNRTADAAVGARREQQRDHAGGRGGGGRGSSGPGPAGRGRGRGSADAAGRGAKPGPGAVAGPAGGSGGGRGGGRGGGGGGLPRKGPKGRSMDPDDPDELLTARGPDDEEEGDVAAAMAALAAREAALREELGAGRAPAEEPEGVVEFNDDGEDGARKRRRLNSSAAGGAAKGHGGGIAAGGGGSGAAPKPAARGNFTPGTLVHAARNVPANGGVDGAAGGGGGGAEGGGGWTQLGLSAALAAHLEQLEFKAPTPIQRDVLPVLLSGRDALVKAQTGSGKTLCYLLPIIQDLSSMDPRISRGEGTYAICIAPTRELCLQIHDVASALLKRFRWIVPGLLIGGEHRGHEKARLRKGVSVLAASPGRLLDHLQNTASFKTTELRWLVLDEADRLLDLGFEKKLREITELINKRQQQLEEGGGGGGSEGRRTVLLSATLHGQLGALAELALRDPAVVGFQAKQQANGRALTLADLTDPAQGAGAGAASGAGGAGDGEAPALYSLPATLRQTFIELPAKERLMGLAALLRAKTARRRVGGTKIVVFLSSCDGVEFHHLLLGGLWKAVTGRTLLPPSVPLLRLHGDMPQAQRTETFAAFAKEGDGVLLCTDVAARGLDFPNVTTIVQYDVPGAPAEYVHRVGRSARMGASGEAVMLLLPHEVPYVNLLRSKGVLLEREAAEGLSRHLPTPLDDGPMDAGRPAKRKGGAAASGDGAARQLAQQFHRQLAVAVSKDPAALQLAQDAFRSYVRAYATHTGEIKRVFAVRNLHLGHVAHAFCLLETPSMLGQSGSAADRKRRKAEAALKGEAERKKKMRKAAREVQA